MKRTKPFELWQRCLLFIRFILPGTIERFEKNYVGEYKHKPSNPFGCPVCVFLINLTFIEPA